MVTSLSLTPQELKTLMMVWVAFQYQFKEVKRIKMQKFKIEKNKSKNNNPKFDILFVARKGDICQLKAQ